MTGIFLACKLIVFSFFHALVLPDCVLLRRALASSKDDVYTSISAEQVRAILKDRPNNMVVLITKLIEILVRLSKSEGNLVAMQQVGGYLCSSVRALLGCGVQNRPFHRKFWVCSTPLSLCFDSHLAVKLSSRNDDEVFGFRALGQFSSDGQPTSNRFQ